MNRPLEPLERDVAALCTCWAEGAGPAALHGSAGEGSGAAQAELERMSDSALVETTDALARLVRTAQGLLARAAGEVSRRSPAESGREGLAKRQGFAGPAALVAAATGGATAEAGRLMAVGKATAARSAMSGEPLPPAHPHVAAALGAGRVGVEAAAAITSMLDRVAPRADPMNAEQVERILVDRAASMPLGLLQRLVREAEARLDQDGVAPREEELWADRSLHLRQDSHGMVLLQARLDPETAAPVKAAIEAIVTHQFRDRRADADPVESGGPAGPAVADDRTVPQMQADALALIAGHVLGCGRVPQAPSTTLVVRTELETLTEGVGHASIDGLDRPISAGAVRRLAAGAGVIPAVLGTESLPLDLGRTARLFSPAQRVALGERDGGCACCGLDVAYTQAHHIRWWERDTGPTDLSNGVLLCPPCHMRMHNDGWEIRVDDGGAVWFIPPPHVDAGRTPRPGGRARYALPRALDAA